MSFSKVVVLSAMTGVWFLAGCASGTYRARQEQREKVSASTGLFCEFVNGEQHPDVDVELNLQMAKRCDMNKQFSITNYRTSSEMNGILYCCQLAKHEKVERAERKEKKHSAQAAPAAKSVMPATKPVVKPIPAATGPSDDEAISDE